jgi:hypothetical protein
VIVVAWLLLLRSEQRAPASSEPQNHLSLNQRYHLDAAGDASLIGADVLRLIDTLLFAAIAASIIGLAGCLSIDRAGRRGGALTMIGARLSSVMAHPTNGALWDAVFRFRAGVSRIFPDLHTITRRPAAIGVFLRLNKVRHAPGWTQKRWSVAGIPLSVIAVLSRFGIGGKRRHLLLSSDWGTGALSSLIPPRFVPPARCAGAAHVHLSAHSFWQSTINLLSERH